MFEAREEVDHYAEERWGCEDLSGRRVLQVARALDG